MPCVSRLLDYALVILVSFYFKDLYLLSREENINLISKQTHKSFNPLQSNINFIDQSPVDHPTILTNIDTAKTLPRSIKDGNGELPRKMFASPEEFKLSVRSLSQTSRNIFQSPEFRKNQFKHVTGYKNKLNNGQSFSSNSSADSDSFNRKYSKEEPNLFAKGINRSTAFHTAELLEKQVGFEFLLRF